MITTKITMECSICDGWKKPYKLSNGEIILVCNECTLASLDCHSRMWHTSQIADALGIDRQIFLDENSDWATKNDINALIDEYKKSGKDTKRLMDFLRMFR